jgi:hypothetical protein
MAPPRPKLADLLERPRPQHLAPFPSSRYPAILPFTNHDHGRRADTVRPRQKPDGAQLLQGEIASTECFHDQPAEALTLPIDALGVDPKQHLDGVAGPLGDLWGGPSAVIICALQFIGRVWGRPPMMAP